MVINKLKVKSALDVKIQGPRLSTMLRFPEDVALLISCKEGQENGAEWNGRKLF